MFKLSTLLRWKERSLLLVFLLCMSLVTVAQTSVFINEIHYDNSGTDSGEFIEIAGPAGTDLTGWTLALYNGSSSQRSVYNTTNLSGTIADEANGFGFVTVNYPTNGIQNGSPDGVALVNDGGVVVQFLSYEGDFEAASGPAAGMTSTNIGVTESSSTPTGFSLQLTGSGSDYEDFTWATEASSTSDAVNNSQTFTGGVSSAVVFINEIHYDNASTDTGEAIELAGSAGTDLTGWTLALYNGTNSQRSVYTTTNLSGVFTDQDNGFGFITFNYPTNGIQNGSPDGVALVDDGGNVVQFLSYEGDFVAASGPAAGMTSENIGVSESSSTPVGFSLQLTGTGSSYEDFTWAAADASTFDAVNNGQSFGGVTPTGVVFINEIHYDNVSSDTGEGVEVAGTAGFDLTGYSVVLYNGSNGLSYNTLALVGVIADETDGYGFIELALPTNGLQNGSPDGLALVDDNGSVIQFLSYEGTFTANNGPAVGLLSEDIGIAETGSTPVGNSLQLIGDGLVYSDFTWAAIPETFDAVNMGQTFGTIIPPMDTTMIHEIQGNGSASPIAGQTVLVEGIVVADFQDKNIDGFFIQEEDADADSDPMTSEGIFIFAPSSVNVSVGDLVVVEGTVTEFFDLTEINNVTNISITSSGNPLPAVTNVAIPVSSPDVFEAVEGMYVEMQQELTVSNVYLLGRGGEVWLSSGDRLQQPTNVVTPGAAAAALQAQNDLNKIIIDDASTLQNPDPCIFPSPELTYNNTLRGGDKVNGVRGVMTYAWSGFNLGSTSTNAYRIYTTVDPSFTHANPRPAAPTSTSGTLKVATFNVLNYFNGDGLGGGYPTPRGADTPAEFDRQRVKILNALAEMDADIYGLVEIENDGFGTNSAIADLVNGLNAISTSNYAFVDPGVATIGSDAIACGYIYKTSTVSLVGPALILDSSVDPAFIDTKNRPALIQSFMEIASGEVFTMANNHFKSKGSACDDVGDPNMNDGQGNCNGTRTAAATALVNYLATDPTGSGSDKVIIMGDLNSYAMEDPITAIKSAGYTDLLPAFQGADAYTYTFDGQWGTLDYVMANSTMSPFVTYTAAWASNSDEPAALDYNLEFKSDNHDTLFYGETPYRSSDHDPVIAWINFNPAPFTLQILHASDLEGGVDAIERAPNFAAIVDHLEDEVPNTVVLSAGDNYIPGPFFNASGDGSMRSVFQDVYQDLFNEPGLTNIREAAGRADITIMNIIGFDASAVGNHEFDATPDAFETIIEEDIRGAGLGDIRWLGAQFPYLSANLDFSNDGDLGNLFTSDILPTTEFQALPLDPDAGSTPHLAPATTIQVGGETVGVVGATTQILESITSVGNTSVIGGGANDMVQLASLIQPVVDQMTASGINKIILVSHLQQYALEQQLATLLTDVDVIIAGGSDAILANPANRLDSDDSAEGVYPYQTSSASNEPVLVVSTDGEYNYVGRLVVDFDQNGIVDPSSVDPNISGPYIADNMMVSSLWGANDAFATGTKGELVSRLTNAVSSIVIAKDGNVFGKTDVYLDGRRSEVRTEETNMGNISADANLWVAQQYDPAVQVSIKNGGGIRAAIGEVVEVSPGVFEFLAPQANPLSGKQEGEVSQLDIENTLRFNNILSVLELSASDLKEVMENGFAGVAPGSTPGSFPQIAGMEIVYNPELPAGARIVSLDIVDGAGTVVDQVVANGALLGDTSRVIKAVTLNFLAGGGDGYPYPALAENRVDLDGAGLPAGTATFAAAGSEQDALAEYLANFFSVTPFNEAETAPEADTRISTPAPAFTLQILHASDLEGGVDAIERAPNFAAIVDHLEDEVPNTVVLSAGDNYIPGPFFNASGDGSMRSVFQDVYQDLFNEPGLTNIREAAGRADITIMNIIGFDASAVGNHEFDATPDAFETIIEEDIRGAGLGDIRWLGAQFPYLSANLDFSNDGDLGNLFTSDILPTTEFQALPLDPDAGSTPHLAPATTIQVGGETVGVVGATTQILESITSVGNTSVIGGGANDMVQLASLIQPVVDQMTASGINKIILVSHLQQYALEQQLATLLTDVDVIIAGGSDAILANPANRLDSDDSAEGVYPYQTSSASNEPVLVVSTDGEYNYVGRLVVDFDQNGIVDPSSVDPNISGPYIADNMMVSSLWGANDAFATGTKGELVSRLTNAVSSIVIAKDGNVFGKTDVYLDGRRSEVRTEETNMGNISADANLWVAQQYDPAVQVSIKNGGGIRAAIGEVVEVSPGVFEFLAPQANPLSGKQEGEVSQLDIENTLRFNNILSVLELSASDLKEVMENGFAGVAPGSTPGSFPQIAGMEIVYNPELPAGARIVSLDIVDGAGTVVDQVVANGALLGDTSRVIKAVTLNFLAGGGDGYPYPALAENRVDLDGAGLPAGTATFAAAGSEQDALAEYLANFFSVTPFNEAETAPEADTRISTPAPTFTLQILHASDLEGGVDAIERAPNFAAIVDHLEDEVPNTVVLSAGDNYIPGPFFNASGDGSMRSVFQDVYQDLFNEPGLTNIREAAGRADITIMNIIGFDASAVGNHEFDATPDAFETIIEEDIRGAGLGDIRWLGAQFPYLSANLDFSNDGDLGNLFTSDILPTTEFQALPLDPDAGSTPHLAPATTIQVGGETVGVVGATTQILESITSVGNTSVIGGGANDMVQLASLIQPVVDQMTASGINKIILVSHLQQYALEQQLATLLTDVDVIIAGGSDAILANPANRLDSDDSAEGVYPYQTSSASNEPVLVVSTDGEYNYVGRLVVDFDQNGIVDPSSVDPNISGPYIADNMMVSSLWGANDAFATGTKGELVSRLTNAVSSIVIAKDGNVFGKTDVYLDGRRSEVRTEETNMGNISADANLWVAQQYDPAVQVSIKNGGGIRAAIGEVVEVSPGVFEFLAPQANPLSGKQEGEVSQLDIENTLRFNNILSVLELSASDLKEVMENGFAGVAPGSTPGSFPQIAGMEIVYNPELPAGARIVSLDIVDGAGTVVDQVVANGALLGDTSRVIKAVTLNFLAGGGDGYPYPALAENRVDLDGAGLPAGTATFAAAGSEQDALAEYLANFFSVTPFNEAETAPEADTRIRTFDPCEGLTVDQAAFNLCFGSEARIYFQGSFQFTNYAWTVNGVAGGNGSRELVPLTTAGDYEVALTATTADGSCSLTSTEVYTINGPAEIMGEDTIMFSQDDVVYSVDVPAGTTVQWYATSQVDMDGLTPNGTMATVDFGPFWVDGGTIRAYYFDAHGCFQRSILPIYVEDQIAGCTSPTACNFNPEANMEDGSCLEPSTGCSECDGENLVLIDADGDGVCDADEVLGCTDPTAMNYDPAATDDDGSCMMVDPCAGLSSGIVAFNTCFGADARLYPTGSWQLNQYEWYVDGALVTTDRRLVLPLTEAKTYEITLVTSTADGSCVISTTEFLNVPGPAAINGPDVIAPSQDDVMYSISPAGGQTVTWAAWGQLDNQGIVANGNMATVDFGPAWVSGSVLIATYFDLDGCFQRAELAVTVDNNMAPKLGEAVEFSGVYPNPVLQGQGASVNTLSGNALVSVFNVEGRAVEQFQVTNGEHVTVGTTLPSGLYQIVISNGHATETHTLVIE